ncbi:E3 ubiquitin-protein ligase RHA2A-like [Durio zibethinus]|uniref:E3 ubiquitin-protein ligase RHA2A-like n=1 Tax=Durio zibethinus TaxID=66656 RepID=A0A6P5Y9Y4_DURZI|nr:E3 ubiquitin-protein ligase RHA2A-like [Durio zibethinus]
MSVLRSHRAFPVLPMKMNKCIPSMFLLTLVEYFKLLFKKAFTHLGLLKPPPEEDYYSANHFSGYVLLMDSRSRSLVPVPIQVVTEMIKQNLPVREYGNFIERFGDDHEQVEKNTICTVCLDSMEKNDEMRELCKCSHVFHKECLDTWVNEGQVTCPLCRSTLYPDRIDWTGRATCSWIIN